MPSTGGWLGAPALAALRAESGNFAAAVEAAQTAGDAALAGRLAVALGDFWYWSGRVEQAVDAARTALTMTGVHSATEAGLLRLLGNIALHDNSDPETAYRHWQAAAIAYMEAGVVARAARLHIASGCARLWKGRLVDAEHHLHLARDLARQCGDRSIEAEVLVTLSELRLEQGRGEEARALASQALVWLPEGADIPTSTYARVVLSQVALEKGDLGGALRNAQAAVAEAASGGQALLADAQAAEAVAALSMGDEAAAARSALLALENRIGARDRQGYGESFSAVAGVAWRAGDVRTAAALSAAAAVRHGRVGWVNESRVARAVTGAWLLSPRTMHPNWEDDLRYGEELSLDEAVRLALTVSRSV